MFHVLFKFNINTTAIREKFLDKPTNHRIFVKNSLIMKDVQYKYTKNDLFSKVRDWHDWVEDLLYILAILACVLVNVYIITLIYLAVAK